MKLASIFVTAAFLGSSAFAFALNAPITLESSSIQLVQMKDDKMKKDEKMSNDDKMKKDEKMSKDDKMKKN